MKKSSSHWLQPMTLEESGIVDLIMTTIPYPVLGWATITVFAAITMSGVQLITQQPLNYRNRMIAGIALALGVGGSSLQFQCNFSQ